MKRLTAGFSASGWWRPVFLEGYWQDERYFSDIDRELRQELSFSTRHTAANEEMANEMRSAESVAVHFRRLQPNPQVGVDTPLATIATLSSGNTIAPRSPRSSSRFRGHGFTCFPTTPSDAVLPIEERRRGARGERGVKIAHT